MPKLISMREMEPSSLKCSNCKVPLQSRLSWVKSQPSNEHHHQFSVNGGKKTHQLCRQPGAKLGISIIKHNVSDKVCIHTLLLRAGIQSPFAFGSLVWGPRWGHLNSNHGFSNTNGNNFFFNSKFLLVKRKINMNYNTSNKRHFPLKSEPLFTLETQ